MGRGAAPLALALAAAAGAAAALAAQRWAWRLRAAPAAAGCARSWLERTLWRTIPLTQHMRVRVLPGSAHETDACAADAQPLLLAAPLGPNVNIHGSAFAGALYSAAVLAGWGWLELHARRAAAGAGAYALREATIVVRSSAMQFRAPVDADFMARAEPPSADELAAFHAAFEAAGKATLALRVTIVAAGASGGAAAGASGGAADGPGGAGGAPAPAPKPACILTGEFTAVHPSVAHARADHPRLPPAPARAL